MLTGFEDQSTEVLKAVRLNLLEGLDRVAESLEDGTFDSPRDKGSAPPSQGGQITLGLLGAIDRELSRRSA